MSTESQSVSQTRPPQKPVYEHIYEVSPREAMEEYLEVKSNEVRRTTVRNYAKHIRFFIKWCEMNGLDSMAGIGGFEFKEFARWRVSEGNEAEDCLSPRTQIDSQKVLRQFIQWCEHTEYSPQGTSEKVRIPSLTPTKKDQVVDYHSVRKMVQYAEKFDYASTRHVVAQLFAETGARPGGLRALDISHYENRGAYGILKFRDDPDNGIRLKNGANGERHVEVSKDCCQVIDDYIQHKRSETVDEYNREPLLVAGSGRIAKSTLRKYVYELSRPCLINGLCPSGLDPDSCPGISGRAHHCEDKMSPKALRKGYITHLLKKGIDIEDVSERCNASPSVIRRHYNQMNLDEERQNRSNDLKRITRQGMKD